MNRHHTKAISVLTAVFLSLVIPRVQAETGFSSILESDRTISMDLQEANLKDVLKIFSIQSGLNFIASEAVKDRKVTLYLDNVPMKDAMVRLFKANKLIYEFDEEANIFTVSYADDISEPDMITRIYQLKHRSVSSANLEKERQNLFTGSAVTSGQFSAAATGAATAQASVAGTNILDAVKQLLSKNGKVSEDNKTNAIIVTDVPSRFPIIEEVIARLDVPQPQVMLEVEMLDVSKNALDNLGFRLGDVTDTTTNAASPMTMILGHNKGFFMGDVALRGASLYTTDVKGNVVFGNTYSMMLNYLMQQKDTKFLARPRILTLNNETAEIGITKDEIVSKKVTIEVSGTDTAGGTTTSTEYERATSLTLTPEGIGIFLRVTPQINVESGEITLVVNPKTSSTSQVTEITEELVRDPEVRSTKSIIKVKDGETVVLGGLIHQDKEVTRQKVPILGDIPVVGALFRHKQTTKNIDRELLVFITPHIVKDPGVSYSQAGKAVPSQYP
ncbi:MAG: secretin N-terminal domain-containing protein, partial [Candidatus Omnitrophica bacterium]|nr:secretin N-terminal domain-containing protein [Candidatus Omnitrophota bacterium]